MKPPSPLLCKLDGLEGAAGLKDTGYLMNCNFGHSERPLHSKRCKIRGRLSCSICYLLLEEGGGGATPYFCSYSDNFVIANITLIIYLKVRHEA